MKRSVFARIAAWLDDLLFPENAACLCCECALGEKDEDGLCAGCRKELLRLAALQEEREAQENLPRPDGIDDIHSAYLYEGAVKRLIHLLKYESVRAAALPLAEQMVFLPSGEEEMIVPVPTDPGRERKRGFNQSALLAQHIGDQLGMRVEHALVRIERRRPQTGLDARQRRENLIGCMAANDAVNGKRVLLVDDVCTTGATLCEAARALREAGAMHVGVLTAARAGGTQDGESDPFAWQDAR